MAFMASYDACVLHPAGLRDLLVRLGMTGGFVLHLIDLSPTAVASVIERQAADLVNPAMTVSELLDHLATSGLPRSVAALRHL